MHTARSALTLEGGLAVVANISAGDQFSWFRMEDGSSQSCGIDTCLCMVLCLAHLCLKEQLILFIQRLDLQ